MSEKRADAEGIEYESQLKQTVGEIRSKKGRRRETRAKIAELNKLLDKPDALFDEETNTALASLHRSDILQCLHAASEEEVRSVDAALSTNTEGRVFQQDPTLREAMRSDEWPRWQAAIMEEATSLREMEVYVPVPRVDVPPGRRVLDGKLVLHRKRNDKGDVIRHKARYVVKGYEQIFGKDYSDTTSPTVRMESLRTMLHIAAAEDAEIQQIDVKTAFLYGLLPKDEEIFMEQIPGVEDAEHPAKDFVWRLQRGLYGMKQAGRVWNKEMNSKMVSWNFERLPSDPCVYVRKRGEDTVWAGVHVDDFITVASSKRASDDFKADMQTAWTISDLGDVGFCLGINIRRDREARTIMLSQTALIEKLAAVAGVPLHVNPVSTPMDPNVKLRRPDAGEKLNVSEALAVAKLPYRQVVGSMMYVAMGTRPDIAFAVSKLAQFLDCYRQEHWLAAVHAVRYLVSTRSKELVLGGKQQIVLTGFSDSSWADCPDSSRSTMGYCFSLGSGAISWASRKQKLVTNSSTDAEYIAINEASREAMFLRQLLEQLGRPCDGATQIFGDNNGALALAKDPVFHSRSKHIKVRYHFVRELIDDGEVDCRRVNTRDNASDVFTKPLCRLTFAQFRDALGIN